MTSKINLVLLLLFCLRPNTYAPPDENLLIPKTALRAGLASGIAEALKLDAAGLQLLREREDLAVAIKGFLAARQWSEDAISVSKALIEIAVASGEKLTTRQLTGLLNAFHLYFEDPEENVEQLVDAFIENGIDPLAVDPAHAALDDKPKTYEYPGIRWSDMTVRKFWEKAGPIKKDLLFRFPKKDSTIQSLFPCKIIGNAFEEAVLGSFGIPKNTQNLNGCVPDGLTSMKIIGGDSPGSVHFQPNIIEIKARMGSTFDYQNQWNQFLCYLNYLQTNSILANTTIMHGLYLILPAGVTLHQNIMIEAGARNVPLLISWVELGNDDLNQFRVKALDFVNVSSLNRSAHLFGFLSDSFIEWSRRKLMKKHLDYQKTVFDFQKYADQFVTSHLTGNSNKGCPPE